MFYLASKIFALFFTPSNLVALLLIAGVGLMSAGIRPQLGRRIAITGVALLAICGFSPLGTLLTLPLEERFERRADPGAVEGIILLGGYEDPGMWRSRGVYTVNEAAERLLETMLLAQKHPKAKVIVTGAWSTIFPNSVDATAPTVEFLVRMGISRTRIIAETESRNTYQNALFTKQIVKPAKGQRYLIVTSAYHMPRSMGVFRQLGFEAVAWPADYRTEGWGDGATPFWWVLQGLERVDVATKEWLGLVAYWISGRSNALFPGR